MKTKKLVTILLVLGSFMAVAGTSSADSISFSGTVGFDHDQVVSMWIFNEDHLDYTFLSDTVSLAQFDPSLGVLNSVELKVESDIDVETYYYYNWDYATTSQHWYSDVIGSVNELEATFSQDHNHHTIGQGYHNYVFTINGTASDSASSGLAAFIGTGTVDVAITGDDKLCAWWNGYTHYDTDTYGTVTATLTYNYDLLVMIDIKPGSYPNSINPNARGVIPVAILTTEDFDASTVDPQTVALEGAGARAKGKSGRYGSMEDVDGDGDLDLVVQIENVIEWDPEATEATLTGETYDGITIQGTDTVNIVPPE
jgi:hypothetical protein